MASGFLLESSVSSIPASNFHWFQSFIGSYSYLYICHVVKSVTAKLITYSMPISSSLLLKHGIRVAYTKLAHFLTGVFGQNGMGRSEQILNCCIHSTCIIYEDIC
jgi:hypothetical protein